MGSGEAGRRIGLKKGKNNDLFLVQKAWSFLNGPHRVSSA